MGDPDACARGSGLVEAEPEARAESAAAGGGGVDASVELAAGTGSALAVVETGGLEGGGAAPPQAPKWIASASVPTGRDILTCQLLDVRTVNASSCAPGAKVMPSLLCASGAGLRTIGASPSQATQRLRERAGAGEGN